MSNEVFIDGICEIDDETIQSYFSQFGSPIQHYDSHRHRPTNSCCFALISFESVDTVNTILLQRPHKINHYQLFVKRLLPPSVCSFIERLLPVSSLFVHNRINKEFDEENMRKYFDRFGHILKFERDQSRDRLLIEFDDYDSVDQIFLKKDLLPNHIEIHKNILPRAQNTIEYHGTCRRRRRGGGQQQQLVPTEEKKKKRHHHKRYQSDDQYEDLLQKTIEDLIKCKAELRNKDTDCVILQMECQTMKDENEKLNEFVEVQKKLINSCQMCQEHEIIIDRLRQTLSKLNDQYETIKGQYQRLISTQHTLTKSENTNSNTTTTSVRRPLYSLSTRLYQDENHRYEASGKCSSQSNLQTPPSSDIVTDQLKSPSSLIQSRIPQSRIVYKYHCVTSDGD